MKRVVILQNVSMPGMPGFKKGQEARMNDEIAGILIERGHAKLEKGKSREAVKKQKEAMKKRESAKDIVSGTIKEITDL